VEPVADHLGFLRPAELADVGAGGEDPLTSGEDHRAGRIRRQVGGGGGQLGEQRLGQGVDLAVVQPDDRDTVVGALHHHQRVRHDADVRR
jgi:hypothetical protein